MPSQHLIDTFLSLRHVAVVGISRRDDDFSHTIYLRLRDGRTLYPVNEMAAGTQIEGDDVYANLRSVPDPLDGVFVIVPAAELLGVLGQVVERGSPMVWIHRGLGQPTVAPEAVTFCAEHGIELVDGACPLMFLEPVKGFHRVHRFFARGRIAV